MSWTIPVAYLEQAERLAKLELENRALKARNEQMRKTLIAIRDATHTSAVVLRGIAAHELEEKE